MTAIRLLLILAICASSLLMTTLVQAKVSELVRLTAKSRVEFGLSKSIVIASYDNGKTEVFAYGNTGNQLSPTPNSRTVFEIGSITKVFMATLLADQVQQGKIALSDTIFGYLPENCRAPALKKITFENLATHFSGLPRMPTNYEVPYYTLKPLGYSRTSLCNYLRQPDEINTAGQSYVYSNLGYGLLGVLLENIAGQSLNQQIEAVIARPLALADTKIGTNNADRERLAQGHHGDIQTGYFPNGDLDGSGAILSTAHDLLKFAAAHLRGAHSSLTESLNLTTKPRRQAWDDTDIGLGWHIQKNHSGQHIYWHNGSSGGFHSFIGFDKASNKAVVVLANSGGDGNDDLGFALLIPTTSIKPTPNYQAITMTDQALNAFVGVYDTNFGVPINVTREHNQLRAKFGDQFALKIFPMNQNTFFYRAINATISFEQTPEGLTLFLHQDGDTYPAIYRTH